MLITLQSSIRDDLIYLSTERINTTAVGANSPVSIISIVSLLDRYRLRIFRPQSCLTECLLAHAQRRAPSPVSNLMDQTSTATRRPQPPRSPVRLHLGVQLP